MNEIFRLKVTNKTVRGHYRLNIDIPKVNQGTFGNKSVRSFVPKIWNSLPHHIKSCENLETFKRVVKPGMALLVTVEYAKISHLKCSKNMQKLF